MKNLRMIRKAHHMTMKELADKIDVSESAISQYENGKRQPSYETLIKLTRIFEVSSDYLLGIEAESSEPMSAKERQILEAYKMAKSSDKEHINALIRAIDKLLKVDE